MDSVACFAPTSPPDTGASRYAQPTSFYALGEVFCRDRRNRTHVDDDLAGLEALRNSILPEQSGLDIRRVRHHRDNDIGVLSDFLRGLAWPSAGCESRRDAGPAAEAELVPRIEEMARHGPSHDAETDRIRLSPLARSSIVKIKRGRPRERASRILERGGLGLILAADPSLVAELIDTAEQEVIIDFAGSGLVTARIVSELNMRDAIEMLRDRRREFALGALHVIDVVLQPKIAFADFAEQRQSLVGAVQIKTGHVVSVDRLNQEPDAGALQFARGVAKIGDQRCANRAWLGFLRRHPRKAIELGATKRLRIGYRKPDAVAELALAAGNASDAAFALRPVSRRKIVQHLRQTVPRELISQGLLGKGVGKEKFDASKPGLRGCGKAVEETRLR